MTSSVLDASVYISLISPSEVHHEHAVRLVNSIPDQEPFLVPSLFRVEVIAALARRGESAELLDTVAVLISGPRFHSVPVDASLIAQAMVVARAARLRAYDSVYVALALKEGATLLTYDLEVRDRASKHFTNILLGSLG